MLVHSGLERGMEPTEVVSPLLVLGLDGGSGTEIETGLVLLLVETLVLCPL